MTKRFHKNNVSRVAVLSVHTSPLDNPGTGDAGGMNVYIVETARRLADLGVEVVLFGSGMGDASSHSNRDLPLLLAGGGFRHGQHKDYPKSGNRQTPACNLFVSMLQKFGLEIDRFGTSNGTLTGLA